MPDPTPTSGVAIPAPCHELFEIVFIRLAELQSELDTAAARISSLEQQVDDLHQTVSARNVEA